MKCPVCSETEVIKAYKDNFVAFKCINGHIWKEQYADNGGVHTRPSTYKLKFEDTLFPKEKLIYETILKELDQKKEFYTKAQPAEKTNAIIQNCKVNETDLYHLMKKIAAFYKQSS